MMKKCNGHNLFYFHLSGNKFFFSILSIPFLLNSSNRFCTPPYNPFNPIS